jgi:hypothetical protein
LVESVTALAHCTHQLLDQESSSTMMENDGDYVEDDPRDITMCQDEDIFEDPPSDSDGFNFESAMKVRKNLSETFDRHASVAEKIARFEQKSAAKLPPRPFTSSIVSSAVAPPTNLSVSLRIRSPVAAKNIKDGKALVNTIEILDANPPTTIRTYPPVDSNTFKSARSSENNVKEFSFQQVFAPETTQHQVYSTVAAPLVHSLFGQNGQIGESALLFAYGITNAGKTYTTMGNINSQSDWGIIPRALQDIFARMSPTTHQLSMSYLEIYNEQVYDLLSPPTESYKPREALKIREDLTGDTFVRRLKKVCIQTVQQGLDLAQQAKNQRHTSSNNINADSSRSHCICQLEILLLPPGAVGAAEINNEVSADGYSTDDEATQLSQQNSVKLWIVDLAGSERTKRTGTLAVRQKEATLINTSLMKLMRCLSALREKQSGNTRINIPFRESKLTHLFMRHLSGPSAARTTMIVNVNPAAADFDETQHVLGYAVAAKSITIAHEDYDQKRKAMGLDEYDMNGRKKRAAGTQDPSNRPGKIARLVQKYSPKNLLGGKKRKVEEHSDKRFIAAQAQVLSAEDKTISLRKEVKTLKAALSIAQAEVASLKLERDEQAEELADLEEKVRQEVSDEMEQVFSQTRQEYDRIIESLQNQVRNNPGMARSERKVKIDKAEKMIEELVEKVDECEEEMVRMRTEHASEMDQLLKRHDEDFKAQKFELSQEHARKLKERLAEMEQSWQQRLERELQELRVTHEKELQELRCDKVELEVYYQERLEQAKTELQESQELLCQDQENFQQESMATRRLPRSRTSKVAVDSLPDKGRSKKMPFGSITENTEDDEDLVFPKKPAVLDQDSATYQRPKGRAPAGREWDEKRGAWRLSVCP